MAKKPVLDPATDSLVLRVLNLQPKPHSDMKLGRPAKAKKGTATKGRAASSKPRGA